MAQFLQVLLSGLATGSIYALAAIGFTLIWQAAQTVNFAQGEFVMLPAFFVLIGLHWLHLPLWLALLFGLIVAIIVLGLPVQEADRRTDAAGRRAAADHRDDGAGDPAEGKREAILRRRGAALSRAVPTDTLNLAGAVISVQDLVNLVVSLAVVVLLTLFLNRTRTGRCMQATAQNPGVAEILGVNIKRMVLYAFLVNAALAALASFLISPIYLAKFSNGETLGLVAFIAAIVGGFNQIRGALAGGLLIGVLDNLTATYVTTEYRAALPLVLLILIILLRPQGLLGVDEGRAV